MSKTPLSLYSSYYADTKVDPAAITNYGGLFPYLDLMLLTDLPKLANENLPKWRVRGWQHAEHIAALLAMNLTGGDCVDDLSKLEYDPGISLYMGQIARAVGAENRQFTRGGDRNIPSLTSAREWLEQFHNAEEDPERGYGQAFVPEANEALSGLRRVNREFITEGFRLYQRSGRPPVLLCEVASLRSTSDASHARDRRHIHRDPEAGCAPVLQEVRLILRSHDTMGGGGICDLG